METFQGVRKERRISKGDDQNWWWSCDNQNWTQDVNEQAGMTNSIKATERSKGVGKDCWLEIKIWFQCFGQSSFSDTEEGFKIASAIVLMFWVC